MRILKWALLLLGLTIAAAGGAILWVQQTSQPVVSGELAAPGVVTPIKILRDTDAVPHIYAGSIADAVYALGFTHAQERAWQMEMQRRIASGRLSELLGAGALDTDKFLRTLGIARRAQSALQDYDATTRELLDRYAAGVNAGFAQHRKPPEAWILQTPPLEPWTPADTVGWSIMMAWDLGGNWAGELNRLRLSSILDKAAIDRLLLPVPGDTLPVTRDYTALYRELGVAKTATVSAAGELIAAAPGGLGRLSADLGSNNWVVHGARTQSGKPVLANDPHLSFAAPALWYLAHLNAPGLNVIGATLPGVPFVLLGRNDHISWGFTNTGPDVQDLFLERVDPANPAQYQTPQGMAPFATRTERIKVKGQADEVLTVRETRHGPVISDVSEAAKKALGQAAGAAKDAANGYVLAFRWTALLPGDLTVQAGMGMNLAKNWPEFLAAVRNFHAPQQNMVFADVQGNIGLISPGRVPLRSKDNDLFGMAPAPGWEPRYDWAGWVPFEELPQQFQPATQPAQPPWIATANNKIVPPGYPHLISTDWALPYRIKRIQTLLDATPKHTPQTLVAIQTDHVSLATQELLPLLRAVKPQGEREKRAVALLAAWDGTMAADRPEPAIAVAWWREAMRQTFSDELVRLWPDVWTANNLHQALMAALSGKPEQAPWCDVVSTPAKETCAQILQSSLPAALDTLTQMAGPDMAAWRWGTIHAVRAEHRPFGKQAQLAKLFDITIPVGGDRFTVNQTAHNMKDDPAVFATRHGAGYRAVYDMAAPDGGSFIHTSGQSGNVFSRRYKDYAALWTKGERVPMRLTRAAVEQAVETTLTLVPAK